MVGRTIMPTTFTLAQITPEFFANLKFVQHLFMNLNAEVVPPESYKRPNDKTIRIKFNLGYGWSPTMMVEISTLKQEQLNEINAVGGGNKKYERGLLIERTRLNKSKSDAVVKFKTLLMLKEDANLDLMMFMVMDKNSFFLDMAYHGIMKQVYDNQNSNLIGLLYVCKIDTVDSLDSILDVSQKMNRIFGISGFLAADDTDVFQYIEGAAENINQLVSNIKRDKRQENFITIITGRLKNRVCPSGWDMRHASHEEYAGMLKDI